MKEAVKFYTSRDSATSVLKKLGIDKKEYSYFIEKMSDGRFACQVAKAQLSLAAPKSESSIQKLAKATTGKPMVAASHTAVANKMPGTKRVSVASTARELIAAGKTNDEVWVMLKRQFNLDDSKKGYPGWYRADMVRRAKG